MAQPALRGHLRGDEVQPIQDFVTLKDVGVDLDVGQRAVTSVRTVPDGRALDYQVSGTRVRFSLPSLKGIAMVEIQYASDTKS